MSAYRPSCHRIACAPGPSVQLTGTTSQFLPRQVTA
jgi:hypothetical protein